MPETNSPITVEMFGGLRLRRDDREPVEFLPQHAGELLALLALDVAHAHSRDELTEHLWPEDDVETARQRLRHCLHRLRRQFELPPIDRNDLLVATRTTIRLNPVGLTTEVNLFESALRSAAREADPARRIALLEGAIRMYDGGLLPGFRTDRISAAQTRLATLYGKALVALAQQYKQAGDLNRSTERALQAIAHDPLLEEAYIALMRLYSAMGQPSAVLKRFQEWERVLREELDEEPSQESRRLMETLRRQAQTKAADHDAVEPDSDALDSRPPASKTRASVPLTDPPDLLLTSAPVQPSFRAAVGAVKQSRNRPRRPALAAAGVLLLIFIITWCIAAIRRPGGVVWTARYEPALDEVSGGAPTAMAVDADGNIYLSGTVFTKNNDADILTLKYNPKGALLWRQRYNGPSNGADEATAIAIDQEGNVLVAGDSQSGIVSGPARASQREVVVLKYDRNGVSSPTWPDTGAGVGVRRYYAPTDVEDYAQKVCVDSSDGSVFVLGNSFVKRDPNPAAERREEWLILKYGRDGRKVWEHRERTLSDTANAGAEDLVLDRAGNAVITGYLSLEPHARSILSMMTIKYSSGGEPIWKRALRNRQFGESVGRRVALDAADNVYLTAEVDTGAVAEGGRRDDIATIKYDANGKEAWRRFYDFNHVRDWPRALAVENLGGIAIAGKTGLGTGSPWNYVTLHYDADGNLLWTDMVDGGGSYQDYAEAVALDSHGNAIVAQQLLDADARKRGVKKNAIHIVKYAGDGRRLWAARFDDGGRNVLLTAVAVDGRDNVIVTGASGDSGASQITTVKYEP